MIDQFMSLVSRGLIRGFRSLIDGAEFLESEQVTRREAEQLCRQHVARLVEQQDRELYGELRPDRKLDDRQLQHSYPRLDTPDEVSQALDDAKKRLDALQASLPHPLPFVPGK